MRTQGRYRQTSGIKVSKVITWEIENGTLTLNNNEILVLVLHVVVVYRKKVLE